MTDAYIAALLDYAEGRNLITKTDRRFAANRLMEIMGEKQLSHETLPQKRLALADILKILDDEAAKKGLCGDTVTERDLFDTRLMGALTPFPHEIERAFWDKYSLSPEKATDWFYKLSVDCNYIRADRMARDLRWDVDTAYGQMEMSVNLSKPEKDPRAIAAAGKADDGDKYPRCLLCMENEGYAGRIDHPARQNLRIVPLKLAGEDWGLQYSPYVYYNEHCIVMSSEHRHMAVNRAAFDRLLDFAGQFPHYFVGSNADLPIVGGSVLSHDHFQGGRHEMPMAKAQIETPLNFPGFEDVEAGIVRWPMSVIRIASADAERLASLAEKILAAWREYTDEDACIYARTDGAEHSTITPIARMRGEKYELDLVLRNNLTTPEHPLGLFHPHEDKHHIKKENIGLIEVMGLAILPGRLKAEMDGLTEAIVSGRELRSDPALGCHADWAESFLPKYAEVNSLTVRGIIQREIGLVFQGVLEDAGVFKRDEAGCAAFMKFIESIR